MNAQELIGTFQGGLMRIGLSVLAASLLTGFVRLLVSAISGKRHSCRFPLEAEGSGESAAAPKLSHQARVVLAALMLACTSLVGKGPGGTNGVQNLPPRPVLQLPAQPAVQAVTPEEIAQGYRLESVTTNDAVSYTMPTNGVEYMPWSLRGGYKTHFPLDLGDDFGFPFGTGVVRRLDVLSGGMVESLPRQRVEGRYSSAMSICVAREYASIVPGVGRFWWAGAASAVAGRPPYRMKILKWENVYAGCDRTGQYNAQIEFHDDGNFITRSNNVERVYRRVLPFDLDNDGLPNTIDPMPEVPLVPSAWNQSEEWAAAAYKV